MFTAVESVLSCLLVVQPPLVTVDRDNVEITESCRIEVAADPIADADGNGVIHITADDVTVEFAPGSSLIGAEDSQAPDTFAGVGIRITGANVTIRGAVVSGYKVGIHATGAGGFIIENCDLSGNFHQRLKSTVSAEDSADWLWPHENDENQWIDRYGAALCIEDSDNVTVRNVRVRDGQNGIILDRVNDSRFYDNDCSFLSGWGLAMWRSSRNVISRNAFDFCVRGYSHEVYNRGQDSAGILMFEQCCENVIAENSATHGGDGFFGFAGREALGEQNPRDDGTWYARRGNNDNLLIGNDFSYAAAHGIEMTFSFSNRFYDNRMIGNAICGVWGGYSQDTHIAGNVFASNGQAGYGAERGGVNIEHGRGNRIENNRFRNNECGVFLWWDNDEGLLGSIWGKVNEKGSSDNLITNNTFSGDVTAIQLRQTTGTQVANNAMSRVETPLDADEQSAVQKVAVDEARFTAPEYPVYGQAKPVGARKHLRGRQNIIMTEWVPYDGEAAMLHLVERAWNRHVYRLLGVEETPGSDAVELLGDARLVRRDGDISVEPVASQIVCPYELVVNVQDQTLRAADAVYYIVWEVLAFASAVDPREDVEAWRKDGEDNGLPFRARTLDFTFGGGGHSELKLDQHVALAELPTDHFGTIATTTCTIPEGRWRLKTTSDDGIRVWMDEQLVIDDWTWHPPKENNYEFTMDGHRQVELRIEHFELDGYAILSVGFEPVK